MMQRVQVAVWLLALCVVSLSVQVVAADASPKIGAVVMHGKGGGPEKLVKGLANYLQANGCLVANLEMPWSGRRKYDVGVDGAVQEVKAALDALQQQGAQKLFVVGHSQGGLFTFYFGGRHKVDGLVAIAPGGNVVGQTYREKVFEPVERARRLISNGKGDAKTTFHDWENAKGFFDVTSTPRDYLSWFDPEGAMNQPQAVKSIIPGVPILYIVPEMDYPGLIRAQAQTWALMPKHPGNKLYEPHANHMTAPTESKEEILRWMTAIAQTN